MRALTWNDFANATGAVYRVGVDGQDVELTLNVAAEIASAGRDGGSFRLEFVGPAAPILPQAIYPFRGDGEDFEIFIVPVGRDGQGTHYEAIFY